MGSLGSSAYVAGRIAHDQRSRQKTEPRANNTWLRAAMLSTNVACTCSSHLVSCTTSPPGSAFCLGIPPSRTRMSGQSGEIRRKHPAVGVSACSCFLKSWSGYDRRQLNLDATWSQHNHAVGGNNRRSHQHSPYALPVRNSQIYDALGRLQRSLQPCS